MNPGPEGGNPSSAAVVTAAPAPHAPPAPAHAHPHPHPHPPHPPPHPHLHPQSHSHSQHPHLPHSHPDNNFEPQQPTYGSLAYPPSGPSQPPHHPPQHFPQQQQNWGYNNFYIPPPHGGPQQPIHPNGAAFQPAFNHYGFGYQNFYPSFGQMPVPGPGPGTMQNGFFMNNGFPAYGGEPPNGDADNFHPYHQPYYPPDHPYSRGGGIGYQHPMPYGNFRPDGFMPPHQPHHPMPMPPKGLNPAAQGFQYQPRKSESLANGNAPNGNAPSMSSATPEIIAPVPEKPGARGSLGLSLEPAVEPEPSPEKQKEEEGKLDAVAVPAPKPAAGKVKEAEAAPPVDAAKASAQVSEASSEAPKLAALQAKASAAETTSPVKKDGSVHEDAASNVAEEKQAGPSGLTFTGASLAGVTSPKSAPSARRRAFAHDPISIRPSRPSPEVQGNSYNYRLAKRIPDGATVEHVEGVRRKRSSEGRRRPLGKAVFAFGAEGGRAHPDVAVVFGEITSAPVSPVVTPVVGPADKPMVTPVVTSSIASPTPSPSTAASSITSPAVAPPPKKPTSWASLLRPAGATPVGSAGPSSTLVSPSKTNVSLPSEAPETPRSTAPSLPPSSGPAPVKPRPAFNYAAAAAVGAPLSPAEDLARLLTEGLRTRPVRPSQPIIPRGLINTGNMCFANTILQVLRYCTPFTELFEELGRRLKADLARRTPLLEAMIVFLREFVPGPSTTNGSSGASTPKGKSRDDAFVPENVYDAMKENKRFDSMRRGYQEDAEEYLGFFLNTLHEELLGLYSRTKPPTSASKASQPNGHAERTIGRPVSPGAGEDGDDWLEVGKKRKTHVVRAAEAHESAITRVFGGTLRSVLHAPGQKDSVTLEPYQPLQLDVQAAQVQTLADALRHLNEPEIVPGVWVAARNAHVDATKQVFFESLPPVLILHLKRFVYDPQEQNVVKRAKPVAYGSELVIPQEIISPPKRTQQPIKYRLFGVVYHHGYSATGGHYTVAVSRPDGTGWLHFDDEAVQPVPAEDVVVSEEEARTGRAGLIGGRERCAYLLFYQRVR